MTTKLSGFKRIATEIDEESCGELEPVENTSNSKTNHITKNKLFCFALSMLGILCCLGVIAVIFTVIWTMMGAHNIPNPNRPTSTIEKCDNLRCCKFKIPTELNDIINCTTLTIEECVVNDDFCEWECYSSVPSYLHRTFVRFDPGIGEFHDEEVNDDVITDSQQIPQSVEEYISQTKMVTYSECGDEYEVELDIKIAEQRFKDLSTQMSDDVSDNVTSYIDMDDESRRRLKILYPDNRWQYTGPTGAQPIFKIYKLVNAAGGGSCTATAISNYFLLTAAHCIYDRNSGSYISGGKLYKYGTSNVYWSVISSAVSGAYITSSSFVNDWGLLKVNWLSRMSHMSYYYTNSRLYNGKKMNGIGFPTDKPYLTLWRQTCTMQLVYATYMKSSTSDHASGENGEAVYLWDGDISRIVYGIWVAHSSSYNYYVRITQQTYTMISDYISNNS